MSLLRCRAADAAMSAAAPLGSSPLSLAVLESLASARGLRLRLRVGRPLALAWSLQVVVARPRDGQSPLWLGELRGWALPRADGLRLDTLRVQGERSAGVAPLIMAATFAWSLECTPCRRVRLLAIRDGERQHRRLVRYFHRFGFQPLRELAAAPTDLLPRLFWGGSGLLMGGDCAEGLARCQRLLEQADLRAGR